VRRGESAHLRAASQQKALRLKHMRWPLLRRGSRVRGRARQKLYALLVSKLATGPAIKGNLLPFLELQIGDLGESLS
jgi:hypothetical protein